MESGLLALAEDWARKHPKYFLTMNLNNKNINKTKYNGTPFIISDHNFIVYAQLT